MDLKHFMSSTGVVSVLHQGNRNQVKSYACIIHSYFRVDRSSQNLCHIIKKSQTLGSLFPKCTITAHKKLTEDILIVTHF